MFDKLRSAFSTAAKSFGEKELNEKDIEDILFELEISLLESDVATEVIDSIKDDLKEKLIGSKVDKKEIEKFVKDSLISSISAHFDAAGEIDLFGKIKEKKKSEREIIFECMSFLFFLRLNVVQNLNHEQIKEIFILNTRKYLN